MNEFDLALEALRYVITNAPDNADAYYYAAMAYKARKNYPAAIDALRESIRLRPDFAEAHYNLGNTFFQIDGYEKAIAEFHKVIELSPTEVRAYNNLGVIHKIRGEYRRAKGFFNKALNLQPGNAEILMNYGNANVATGEYDAAIGSYNAALRLKPNSVEILVRLGRALRLSGKPQEACLCYQNALEIDPNSREAKFNLATLGRADTPEHPDSEYITRLFDNFAHSFDRELVENLEYRIPEKLYSAVKKTLARSGDRKLKILDLGCGTGLCGPLFKELARSMVGVDLSFQMLSKASTKHAYDSLIMADILAPPFRPGTLFDLVISADVFIYVGALDPVFELCESILRVGGWFAFTTEDSETGKYTLKDTARYGHSPEYIDEMAGKYGFEIIFAEPEIIRKEKGDPVHGGLAILQKRNTHAGWR
jgi:predicted TPR repeat methyltransferase